MDLLYRLWCGVLKGLGFPVEPSYNKEEDPLFHKYEELDCRADNLRKYWKPRDLLDLR